VQLKKARENREILLRQMVDQRRARKSQEMTEREKQVSTCIQALSP
jgi:hypothetical protein